MHAQPRLTAVIAAVLFVGAALSRLETRVAGRVFHFGVLAPLALLGLWATWPRRGALWLLYLLPGVYVLTLVAFAVMACTRWPTCAPSRTSTDSA